MKPLAKYSIFLTLCGSILLPAFVSAESTPNPVLSLSKGSSLLTPHFQITPDFSTYPKDDQGRPFADGQVIVEVDPKKKNDCETALMNLGYQYNKSPFFNGFLLQVPNGTVLEHVSRLKDNPRFKRVSPNYKLIPLSYTPYPYPDDPNYQNGNDEWNVNAVHMDQAWNSTDPWIANASLGRPSAIIAISDSGLRITHEEFTGKLSNPPGWDFNNNDNDLSDTGTWAGHGTAVAGLASVNFNNGIGGVGICANCSLMVLKSSDGVYQAEQGFNYAFQNGARAINCSWGAPVGGYFDYYTAEAFNNGELIIGASGNSGINDYNNDSPSDDPDAIAVGACDINGDRCSFSTFSTDLALVAPDCPSVFTTVNTCDTCYGFFTGTSCAAPQVSAMAAILLDLGLSPAAVTQCLYTTADPLGGGFNIYTGWGRMNCFMALAAIRPPSSLSAASGNSSVTLNWVAPQTTAFATSDYIVSRSTVTGGPYNLLGQTSNDSTLSFTDTSTNPSQTYYYVVQAVDAKGNTTVVSNEASAVALGPTYTPTPTFTATITTTPTPTGTPTPNYGEFSGWTFQGLWHPVNDLTSPCPNSHTPPWAAYYGIDSQCNFQSGNTMPSTLIMPSPPSTVFGNLTFWVWIDGSPNGVILQAANLNNLGCGFSTIYPGAQKTWVPIQVNCGVGPYMFIAYAVTATGNTGRGIYIDDAGIGYWTPSFTPTITSTGTISPSPTPTPTFNEFVGTPTFR